MTFESPNLLQPATPAPRRVSPQKKLFWYIAFFSLTFLVAVVITIHQFSLDHWPTDAAAYDAATLRPKQTGFFQTVKNFIFNSDKLLEGQGDDRINILLLGMGGPGHDGPYLTDTNIIVSLRPSTNEVALISIPRDLGVDIPGHGLYKINHANSFGELKNLGQGGEFARQIFAKTFDLDIPYYVRVDFTAFKELVDSVGGLSINVPRTFTDTAFPGPNFSYRTVQFQTGTQLLNGDRALEFSRSRHGNNGEGSDFARSHRQQLVLSALKEKLLSFSTYTNPIKVQQILNSLETHISTNLDFGQLMYLVTLAKDAAMPPKMLVLDDAPQGYLVSTIAPSGAFLLSPKPGSFATINTAIQQIFSGATTSPASAPLAAQITSTTVFHRAVLEIQNGTWRVGQAARLRQGLETQGFSVARVANALQRPVTTTAWYIIDPTVSPEVLAGLERALGRAPAEAPPEWLKFDYDDPGTPQSERGRKFASSTQLLIIVGNDLTE